MNKRVENKLDQIRRQLQKLETEAHYIKVMREDVLYAKAFKRRLIWGCVCD